MVEQEISIDRLSFTPPPPAPLPLLSVGSGHDRTGKLLSSKKNRCPNRTVLTK